MARARTSNLWVKCPNGHAYKARNAQAKYRICGECGESWRPEAPQENADRGRAPTGTGEQIRRPFWKRA